MKAQVIKPLPPFQLGDVVWVVFYNDMEGVTVSFTVMKTQGEKPIQFPMEKLNHLLLNKE